jgi:catechol 2,3-dioxygenase-like lactoylglutathione lyase family enzyme
MRIHHVQIMVPVDRLEEARGYYEGLLELQPVPRHASERPGLWYACGDLQLHLGTQPGLPDPTSRAHVAFAVSDLDRLRRCLEEAGFEIKDASSASGARRFHTRDPFGNRLEFTEERP